MKRNLEEIVPGFYKISLPVPIPSLKNVFVYLVSDKGHSLLIDTGWAGAESYRVLRSSFDSLDFELHSLEKIVISHLHPDHFGLMSRLKKEVPGVILLMHGGDARQIRTNTYQMKPFWTSMRNWMHENGVPSGKLAEIVRANEELLGENYPIECDTKLREGEKLRVGRFALEVIHTPGHTKGSICLYDRSNKLLFSGDHILPTITPNISLSPSYPENPLRDYLESLHKLRSIRVSKVLPSHQYVFTDLQPRIREIERHHMERLRDCQQVLDFRPDPDRPALFSAFEIASKLEWYSGPWETLGPWGMRAALGETAAHLEYLHSQKKISRQKSRGKTFYRLRS